MSGLKTMAPRKTQEAELEVVEVEMLSFFLGMTVRKRNRKRSKREILS